MNLPLRQSMRTTTNHPGPPVPRRRRDTNKYPLRLAGLWKVALWGVVRLEDCNENHFIDMGMVSYIILYGLLFYTVSDDNLRKWETPQTDYLLIKRVSIGAKNRNILTLLSKMRYFFETIFGRYLRNRLGPDEFKHKNFRSERHIVKLVTEVTRILTLENLQLDDFSNSRTIEATSLF